MFLRDLKKFKNYAWYSAICELKGQVSDSYLGYLWWILDPLLYVLVYSFVVITIFKTNEENLPMMVFIGVTAWTFFSSTITSATSCIKSYSAVTKKVYIPKSIICLMINFINFIKMIFGIVVSIIGLVIFKIPFSIKIIQIVPLLIVFFMLTYALSLVCATIGVYVSDFKNVVVALLRLIMYLSCPFYDITRFPQEIVPYYNKLCATGFFVTNFRKALMYNTQIDYLNLLYWFIVSIVILIIGLKIIYKHENEYMKVS